MRIACPLHRFVPERVLNNQFRLCDGQGRGARRQREGLRVRGQGRHSGHGITPTLHDCICRVFCFLSPVHFVHHVSPVQVACGASGSIVNIASHRSLVAGPNTVQVWSVASGLGHRAALFMLCYNEALCALI